MPPLTGQLRREAGYHALEWLPDGYPGRRRGDEVWAHPLYGAYVLQDYLAQLESSPSQELRDGLRSVATAAVARMDRHEGALVFWYEEDEKSARAVERHYSGLTQGYYAAGLARAARVLGDDALLEVSASVFASLTVPVSRGGVHAPGVLGPSIAEVSQQPNSYILNGWQSALTAVADYAEVTGRADARQLACDSAREIARLLPLFDAPAVRNSRYGLTGFVYARLVFRGAETGSVTLRDTRLSVPGEGEYAVARRGGRRWLNHVFEQDVLDETPEGLRPAGRVARLNLVLSRISYPQPNRLRCRVSGAGGLVEVQLQQGRYDPLQSAQVDRHWVSIAQVDCPPGDSEIDVPLPWDVAELVAYPTNFVKSIDGRRTNVYHATHVTRLRELAAATGVPELAEWADTWLRYVAEWRSMPLYSGLHVRWEEVVLPVSEVGGPLPPAPARLVPTKRSRSPRRQSSSAGTAAAATVTVTGGTATAATAAAPGAPVPATARRRSSAAARRGSSPGPAGDDRPPRP